MNTLERLCIAAGMTMRNIAYVPSDPAERERAAQKALADYAKQRAIPRPEPGRTSIDWELRVVVQRAHAELRRLDAELAAVTAQRHDLAELLGRKSR